MSAVSTSHTTSATARMGIPASVPIVDGELVSLPSDVSALDHFFLNDLFQSCGLDSTSTPMIWHAIGAQEGFLLSYCKPPGEELNRYRATAELPVDVDRLQVLLRDVQNLKVIQPNMVNVEVLKKIDDDHQIVRIELKLPAIMANREVVVLMSFHKLSSGPHKGAFVVNFNSVNLAPYNALANPNNVRAKIIRSGYVMEPISASSVRFTSIFEADLEGWMPSGLQNFAAVHGIQQALSSLASKKEDQEKEDANKKKEANPDFSGLSNKTLAAQAGNTGKESVGSVGGTMGGNHESVRTVMGRPL